MPDLIITKEEQLKIFRTLHDQLKERFSSSFARNQYDCLRSYIGRNEFANFGLDFWIRHSWVGVSIWGPSIEGAGVEKNILGFATYSPKSRVGSTAGALAVDTKGIALYHDGRVYTGDGRRRPQSYKPKMEINGRNYYKISYVDDDQFFDYVMDYHLSRIVSSPFLSDDAIEDIGSDDPSRVNASCIRYSRDKNIRDAVKLRAGGKCEFCGKKGFVCDNGVHYLECHHIIALANEGADRMTNVIALCPEHHREAHFGKRREALENEMIKIVRIIGK